MIMLLFIYASRVQEATIRSGQIDLARKRVRKKTRYFSSILVKKGKLPDGVVLLTLPFMFAIQLIKVNFGKNATVHSLD